ncbi:MAG: F0F1 ATP synthase subunit B, partial [Burkholderiales bacterium]
RKIADGLAAAERGKQDLAQAEQRSNEALTEARAKAAEIIALSEKRRNEIIEEAREEAKVEANRVKAHAQAEVDQEILRAKETLRDQVADLVVSGAEKILRREINAQAHSDLLIAIRAEL